MHFPFAVALAAQRSIGIVGDVLFPTANAQASRWGLFGPRFGRANRRSLGFARIAWGLYGLAVFYQTPQHIIFDLTESNGIVDAETNLL